MTIFLACTSLAGLALAGYCWHGWSKSAKRELSLRLENNSLRASASRRHLHLVPDDKGAA